MVLAVGILVDDAIVVVENVERITVEEGLPPKEATRKAMSQDHGRHHRHYAGLDRGVRADGVLPGIGRRCYLPPRSPWSRRSRSRCWRCRRRAMRDLAETGDRRPRPCLAGRVRLVQPRARQQPRRLFAHRRSLKRTGQLMMIYAALLDRLGWAVRSPAWRLPARR